MQPAQSRDVAGHQVVLDDASVLGSVAGDDGMVIKVRQLSAPHGLAVMHVPGTLGLDHRPGHLQPRESIGRATAIGQEAVGVLGDDLVAEEPRPLAAGVGDQRLFLVQFQLELVL